jgi:MFS family permease
MQGHSFKVLPLAPRSADFDPRPIDPVELPGIMRRHIYTGAMAGVYGTFTNGIFLIAFGNALGVTVLQWGVHGAITCFALALQIISAHFGACHGRRKLLWWAAESTARLLKTVALVSALAFYAYGYPGAAAMSLITWLCISSMFSAVAAPVWYSWLVDIIPERVHGRFMGRRDLWISLLTVAAVIPAGWAIDAFGDELKTTVLAAIFLAGVVLGILDVSLHRVIPEPPTDRDSGTSLWARLRVPLHDPEFRPWLTFVGVWNFAMFLGGALSGIYFIENLGLRDNFLGGAVVLIVVPLLAVVFTSKWLGALVDSIGVKRMLVLSHFCWALLPAFWVLATPQTAIFWLGLSSIIGGAAGSPAVNAANKLVSRTPPAPAPRHVPRRLDLHRQRRRRPGRPDRRLVPQGPRRQPLGHRRLGTRALPDAVPGVLRPADGVVGARLPREEPRIRPRRPRRPGRARTHPGRHPHARAGHPGRSHPRACRLTQAARPARNSPRPGRLHR